ncbi:S8 family serine peptidase, partial [Planctomycetota bacterium]
MRSFSFVRTAVRCVCSMLLLGMGIVVATSQAWAQAPPAQAKPDYGDPIVRDRAVTQLRERSEQRKAAAVAVATQLGLPVRGEAGGRLYELMAFEEGVPVYYMTDNVNAGISTGASLIRSTAPYSVTGSGETAVVWDAGSVLTTHQEFGTRVTVKDGSASDDHSTHVGGTIGAAGVDAAALGMAPDVLIDSYDWNSDVSEMLSRGASYPNEPDTIGVSNHSYGYSLGWVWKSSTESGESNAWHWVHSGSNPTGFGQYHSYTVEWDAVAYGTPYYLICKSSGNDRTDGPSTGETAYVWNGSGYDTVTYDSATHPKGDGVYNNNGYDCITWTGNAKNILTVGAVNDAVTDGTRDLSKATMSSFSSWGPADDGRVKPDVVGNGVGVYSSVDTSDSAYDSWPGTSMSTPNVCGSIVLLHDYMNDLFPGHALRASTVKGLVIHTADDLGNPGPDYANGWGLVNVKAAADVMKAYQTSQANQKILEGRLTTSTATDTHTFAWDGSDPIRVTLCWTDPAGTAQTAHDVRTAALVNDLDLLLTGPGSTDYYPYVLDVDNPANNATTGENDVDNVEQVYLASPATGIYTVTVDYDGTLTNEEQFYSLVISGGPATGTMPTPQITGVSPSGFVGGSSHQQLAIDGGGFVLGADVKLARTGQPDITATGTQVTPEHITAYFDLGSAATGWWDVVVTNTDAQSATLPNGVYVDTVTSQTLLSTDFGSGLPSGWSVVDGDSDGNKWTSTNPGSRTDPNWTGTFMIVDSDDAGEVAMDEELITESFDCPPAYSVVTLSFKHYFKYYAEGVSEKGDVDVRIGAGSWQNVAHYTADNSGTVNLDISSIAAGQSSVQVRWRYYDANWDWYWGIDDVSVEGATAVSVPLIIHTSAATVSVPEGGTTGFSVWLSQDPATDTTVTIGRTAGDGNINVQSGSSLTFTEADYDTHQTVTLSAAEDDADVANGQATITCSAPDLPSSDVTANEADDDLTLTVTSAGHGGVTGGGIKDSDNTPFAISATPDGGYEFVSWTGADVAKVANANAASTTIGTTVDASVTANFNAPPVIAQGPSVPQTMDEDGTPTAWSAPEVSATDLDGDTLTWSKPSGPSHGTASVGGTGASPAPFTYSPAANWNGSDSFLVEVSDGEGGSDTITVHVTVQAVNDPPSITSGSTANVPENWTDVMTVTSSDPDAGDAPTYSLSGGADQAKFTIGASTGALAFAAAPDFETPEDLGDTAGNNTYVVNVQVTDGGALTATRTVTVTVTDKEIEPLRVAAALLSPTENTTFTSSTLELTWEDVGAAGYWISVGSMAGWRDLYDRSEGMVAAATIAGAPTDGRKLYVRLYSQIGAVWPYHDYVFTAHSAATATLTSPANGSTLTSPNLQLTWSDTGANQYHVRVGSNPGWQDLHEVPVGTATVTTITGLPTDGRTLHVRLFSRLGYAWFHNDYSFTAHSAATATLTSPASGSTLTSASMDAAWNDTGANEYHVRVGSNPGWRDLHDGSFGTATATTITGLPADGRTLYFQLFSRIGNVWSHNDYSFTAHSAATATLTSPTNGSTLTSASLELAWDDTGANQYHVWVGSSPGWRDLHDGTAGTATAATITGLPVDGRTLHVRLHSRVANVWSHNEYSFTAYSATLATLLSPTNGSTLTSTSLDLTWNDARANQYHVWVGSNLGWHDFYGSSSGTATATTVTGLPADGRTLHVRLFSKIGNAWSHNDYSFTAHAATKATLLSPTNGSTLASTSLELTWNDARANQYWVYVGTTSGWRDLYDSSLGTATATTITGIPADGRALHVRLLSRIGNVWSHNDYSFTAYSATPATLLSPADGSTLTSARLDLTWTDARANQYWVRVGSMAGWKDLHNSSAGTATSATLRGMPLDGRTLYVQLYSRIGDTWLFNEYSLSAHEIPPRIVPVPARFSSAGLLDLNGGVTSMGAQ